MWHGCWPGVGHCSPLTWQQACCGGACGPAAGLGCCQGCLGRWYAFRHVLHASSELSTGGRGGVKSLLSIPEIACLMSEISKWKWHMQGHMGHVWQNIINLCYILKFRLITDVHLVLAKMKVVHDHCTLKTTRITQLYNIPTTMQRIWTDCSMQNIAYLTP